MTAAAKPVPVVLVASGTATGANEVYPEIEAACRRRFPEHPFYLAFSSRAIRKQMEARGGHSWATPETVLQHLHRSGHPKVVVQSLHLICGIEFHHMVWSAASSPLDIHLGLPLLAHPEDFETVLDWIADVCPPRDGEGLVLVGHGTAHPAWMAYAVLDHKIAARFGRKVVLGQVRGEPSPSVLAARLAGEGCRRVHLRPFMLVAGAHFMRDVAGRQATAWQALLEKEGLTVIPKGEGLGSHPAIIDVFCRHIEAALSLPPLKLN
jgi:sirohydrochlorin cobaltochelatase